MKLKLFVNDELDNEIDFPVVDSDSIVHDAELVVNSILGDTGNQLSLYCQIIKSAKASGNVSDFFYAPPPPFLA